MNQVQHHIHHHTQNVSYHAQNVAHHVKKHHKKYFFLGTAMAVLLGITKVILFFATSFAIFASSHDTSFADDLILDPFVQNTGTVVLDSEDVLPESVNIPSEYDFLIGPESSPGIVSDSGTVSSIDSGTLLYLMAAHLSGDTDSAITSTDFVDSRTVVTGTVLSGIVTTGSTAIESSIDTTTPQYYEELLNNQVIYCHTGDILMNTTFSGNILRGIIPFAWTYSGSCIPGNLSFQLYDHNNNWIELVQLSGSSNGFSFNSKFLFTGGWYSITGLNQSGQIYIINSGLYSGFSTPSWTGYKVRIINSVNELLYQSSGFTIDNESPTLTGVNLLYSGALNSGEVHLFFSGSEILSDISISLSTGRIASRVVSGTSYDYYLYGFSSPFIGTIDYIISFSDIAGNTGMFTGSKYLSFSGNRITPQLTGSLSALLAMKQEFSNFAICKNNLKYQTISLSVGNKKFDLRMPTFEKAEVKKLVSAFSYFVVKKLDSTKRLTQADLNDITKKYNDFLVVLKLMKDDDNKCQQNLSTYYLTLFGSTMVSYGITDL